MKNSVSTFDAPQVSRFAKFFSERHFVIGVPYGWLLVFFFIPFLIILKISFSETIIAVPPFTSIVEWGNQWVLKLSLNLKPYGTLLTNGIYGSALLGSLAIAALSTLCCLLIGYPLAYAIVRAKPHWRLVLLLLVILPFWTSFLMRVYAWISLLGNQGIINSILLWLGLIKDPLPLLYNAFSVGVGIVYCYLPFMVFPIYASLEKIDIAYLEAAYDLGCRPWSAFWHIVLPLSMPGILAGSTLVFVPAVGEFVIPELLGGPNTLMIGRVLWVEFFNNGDWPLACALAVTMLIVLVVPIMVFQRVRLRAALKNVER